MKAKKQTAGEKLAVSTVGNLNRSGERAFLARRIDALVRRAVKRERDAFRAAVYVEGSKHRNIRGIDMETRLIHWLDAREAP